MTNLLYELSAMILIQEIWIKGTVSVISSDPSYKYGNEQFTALPLKICLIKDKLDINVCDSDNYLFSTEVYL